MKTNYKEMENDRIKHSEEEYKKIPLNKANILKLLKVANNKALKSYFIAMSLVTIGGLLTDKKFNIKKVSKRPKLLLTLLYSLRYTGLFSYGHSFTYSILSEILPIITKLNFLTSDIIAGLISGLTVLLDTPKQQSFCSLWSLSNSVQAACLYLHKENILRLPYGANLIFSTFVSQLFYSLLYHPLSLQASDLRGLKSLIPLGSIKSLFMKNEESGYDPTLFEIIASNKDGELFDTLCTHAHSQDITCASNSILTGVHFAKENFNYFAAISILPTIILDFKSLRERPFKTIFPKLKNLSKTLGTIFLTSTLLNYQVCKSAWSQSTRNTANPLRYLILIQGFLTGLITSKIPNNKRLVYFNSILGMSSITSLFNILRKKGLIIKFNYFHAICYSVCYTILLALMRHYPSVLNPTMKIGLKSFFIQNRILKPEETTNYDEDQDEIELSQINHNNRINYGKLD